MSFHLSKSGAEAPTAVRQPGVPAALDRRLRRLELAAELLLASAAWQFSRGDAIKADLVLADLRSRLAEELQAEETARARRGDGGHP